MTDFLTRLAERTLGQSPLVQPLLGSRYATGPAAPLFPDIVGEEQVLVVERPADPAQTPMPRFPEEAPSTLESVLPRRVSDPHAASEATEAFAKGSQEFEKAAGPHEPLPPREVSKTQNSYRTTELAAASADPDASFSADSLRAHQSPPVRAPSAGTPDRRGEAAFSHAFLAPVALDTLVQANPSARLGEEAHAASLLLSPEPQEAVEARRGGMGVFDRSVVERAVRRAEVVRPQSAAISDHGEPISSANASGSPAIRVTIGRIEVRAILPPTPAAERAAPARAGPPLSLDEYLKQRSEGPR